MNNYGGNGGGRFGGPGMYQGGFGNSSGYGSNHRYETAPVSEIVLAMAIINLATSVVPIICHNQETSTDKWDK